MDRSCDRGLNDISRCMGLSCILPRTISEEVPYSGSFIYVAFIRDDLLLGEMCKFLDQLDLFPHMASVLKRGFQLLLLEKLFLVEFLVEISLGLFYFTL